MPKIKTHKGTKKRFRITSSKKIMARQSGQDHFNSRERGRTTRNKRRDEQVNDSNRSSLRKLIPYT
ncbi:MAG: 50S ribosomal protein L35 [Patescibacteria group bacterium]|nr:50S ribosomal protein L35 [Patescibacteria group bacterium]